MNRTKTIAPYVAAFRSVLNKKHNYGQKNVRVMYFNDMTELNDYFRRKKDIPGVVQAIRTPPELLEWEEHGSIVLFEEMVVKLKELFEVHFVEAEEVRWLGEVQAELDEYVRQVLRCRPEEGDAFLGVLTPEFRHRLVAVTDVSGGVKNGFTSSIYTKPPVRIEAVMLCSPPAVEKRVFDKCRDMYLQTPELSKTALLSPQSLEMYDRVVSMKTDSNSGNTIASRARLMDSCLFKSIAMNWHSPHLASAVLNSAVNEGSELSLPKMYSDVCCSGTEAVRRTRNACLLAESEQLATSRNPLLWRACSANALKRRTRCVSVEEGPSGELITYVCEMLSLQPVAWTHTGIIAMTIVLEEALAEMGVSWSEAISKGGNSCMPSNPEELRELSAVHIQGCDVSEGKREAVLSDLLISMKVLFGQEDVSGCVGAVEEAHGTEVKRRRVE